MEGENYFDDYC